MCIRDKLRKLVPEPLLLFKRRVFRVREGEIAIRARYLDMFGKPYDPDNARTFTDKVYRRMIELNRNSDDRFGRFADKFTVRDYIRETIGECYLTQLFWSGIDPSKIPFNSLPAKCIIKTNHGCGGHIVYNPAMDRCVIVAHLRKNLADNYFWAMREYQYYNIRPRVIIEELLDDGFENGPLDYRIWCFDGKPEIIQVDNHTHSINPFYSLDWTKLPIHYRAIGLEEIPKPVNLGEMIEVASKLSKGFDFVRVDLFNVKGRVVFGEMTLAPAAGSLKIDPPEWDLWLGEKWP